MKPFEPTGERAMWRLVYDLVVDLRPGDVVTYEQLTDVLGYDPSEPGRSRTPIHRASEQLLVDHSRTLVAVRKAGYRVAQASEHEHLARGQQRSARRRIGKGVSLATHVDVSALTSQQRAAVDAVAQVLMVQQAMLSRHDKRIGRVEKDVHRVDDRIAALEMTLARHGISVEDVEVVPGELAMG